MSVEIDRKDFISGLRLPDGYLNDLGYCERSVQIPLPDVQKVIVPRSYSRSSKIHTDHVVLGVSTSYESKQVELFFGNWFSEMDEETKAHLIRHAIGGLSNMSDHKIQIRTDGRVDQILNEILVLQLNGQSVNDIAMLFVNDRERRKV